jgi:hypothetical protein
MQPTLMTRAKVGEGGDRRRRRRRTRRRGGGWGQVEAMDSIFVSTKCPRVFTLRVGRQLTISKAYEAPCRREVLGHTTLRWCWELRRERPQQFRSSSLFPHLPELTGHDSMKLVRGIKKLF